MNCNDMFVSTVFEQDKDRADQGDDTASTRVGYRYFVGGAGQVPNWERARYYFRAAAPTSPAASAWLAFTNLIDRNLRSTPAFRKENLQRLTELADVGDPVGQTLLGMVYERGRGGTTADPVAAKALYQAAFPQFALAGTRLGEMLLREGDPNAAIALFKEAANAGETAAMSDLADLLGRRLRPPKPVMEVKRLLRRAAQRGNARATYRLGVLYLRAGAKGRSRGIKLLERSAKIGYQRAQAALGICYQRGMGVARNDLKAQYWLALGSKHISRAAAALGVSAGS